MESGALFKVCNGCGKRWQTAEQFILDPSLQLVMYQAVFGEVEYGLFVLTHDVPECQSSISVSVGMFRGLVPRDHQESGFLDPKCEDRCFSQMDLAPCNVDCSMKWARDVMQCLKEHKLPPGCGGEQNSCSD